MGCPRELREGLTVTVEPGAVGSKSGARAVQRSGKGWAIGSPGQRANGYRLSR